MIRDMEKADAKALCDEYTAQGGHPEEAYYHMRMKEAAEGKCVALEAEYQGKPSGCI